MFVMAEDDSACAATACLCCDWLRRQGVEAGTREFWVGGSGFGTIVPDSPEGLGDRRPIVQKCGGNRGEVPGQDRLSFDLVLGSGSHSLDMVLGPLTYREFHLGVQEQDA